MSLQIAFKTRRALGGAHVPPTKVFRRLSEYNHFKTTRRCSGGPRQYAHVGFSRRKIPLYDVRERNPDYNPDRAEKLISSSMSRHLSTRNISSKSMHAFLSNLANRQTDKQTRAKTCTFSFVGGKQEVTGIRECGEAGSSRSVELNNGKYAYCIDCWGIGGTRKCGSSLCNI